MNTRNLVRAVATAAMALPSAAWGHEGEIVHHHPHGSEAIQVALIVAAAAGGYALARFQGRRK